jgi:hypothetical protein
MKFGDELALECSLPLASLGLEQAKSLSVRYSNLGLEKRIALSILSRQFCPFSFDEKFFSNSIQMEMD